MFTSKKLKELEEEIKNQDDQYNLLQTKFSKKSKECALQQIELEQLRNSNEKHLETIAELRKNLKGYKKENQNVSRSSKKRIRSI